MLHLAKIGFQRGQVSDKLTQAGADAAFRVWPAAVQVRQRGLIIAEIYLELLAAILRDDGLDCGFFRSSVVHVANDTVTDSQIIEVEVLFGFGLRALWHPGTSTGRYPYAAERRP